MASQKASVSGSMQLGQISRSQEQQLTRSSLGAVHISQKEDLASGTHRLHFKGLLGWFLIHFVHMRPPGAESMVQDLNFRFRVELPHPTHLISSSTAGPCLLLPISWMCFTKYRKLALFFFPKKMSILVEGRGTVSALCVLKK